MGPTIDKIIAFPAGPPDRSNRSTKTEAKRGATAAPAIGSDRVSLSRPEPGGSTLDIDSALALATETADKLAGSDGDQLRRLHGMTGNRALDLLIL